MKTEQFSYFDTKENAEAAAAHFIATWGGSDGWNPYSPTTVIVPPDKYCQYWRLITARYSSAE